MSVYFYSLFNSLVTQINLQIQVTSIRFLTLLQPLSCTLSISDFFINSTHYYGVISAVELSNVSTPITKANFSSEFVQTEFSSISGLSSSYHGTKSMWNTEWFFKNLIQLGFNKPIKFSKCLTIHTNRVFI